VKRAVYASGSPGGAYALEQLAEVDVDKRYRGHAHALLTAFIRQHAPWSPETTGSEPTTASGVADGIGAALAVLSGQAVIIGDASTELERVDLRDADLDGVIADRTTTSPPGFTPPRPTTGRPSMPPRPAAGRQDGIDGCAARHPP
jgi:hypothetical protein